jgi:hypothetical protein
MSRGAFAFVDQAAKDVAAVELAGGQRLCLVVRSTGVALRRGDGRQQRHDTKPRVHTDPQRIGDIRVSAPTRRTNRRPGHSPPRVSAPACTDAICSAVSSMSADKLQNAFLHPAADAGAGMVKGPRR